MPNRQGGHATDNWPVQTTAKYKYLTTLPPLSIFFPLFLLYVDNTLENHFYRYRLTSMFPNIATEPTQVDDYKSSTP